MAFILYTRITLNTEKTYYHDSRKTSKFDVIIIFSKTFISQSTVVVGFNVLITTYTSQFVVKNHYISHKLTMYTMYVMF